MRADVRQCFGPTLRFDIGYVALASRRMMSGDSAQAPFATRAERTEKTHEGIVATTWRNRVGWARYRLVEDGLLRSDSPRGVWELTEEGAKAAAAIAGE